MLLHSRIFWAQLLVLLVIALIHISALSFDLYWYFVWLDVPVHFLGGAWCALALLWIVGIRGNHYLNRLIPVVVSVLCVGIAWEVFEVMGGISIYETNYWFDTSVDLLADFLGALAGFWGARTFLFPRI